MKTPIFIDNRYGNTLAEALEGALGERDRPPRELRIATGFFSPTGFARIADLLTAIPHVRLMIGVDLGVTYSLSGRRLGESHQAYTRRRLEDGVRRTETTLIEERNQIPFTRTARRALHQLIVRLRSGNIEVKRYRKGFLHAKSYVLGSDQCDEAETQGVIVGSSNLTTAGLTSNLELNLGRYDQPVVAQARQWFDELWDEAEDYDLAAILEAALEECTPWEIFIRVLWQLYGDEVDEDAREDQNLPLTSFQKHGVVRALRLIRETGGAIVADEVGLGKTYIAGEILQVYRERRQRALLVCPASVRDNVWRTFTNQFEIYLECVSFEQLAQDPQLHDTANSSSKSGNLQRKLDEYQLIVIDEAHNYRNPDAPTRAGILRKLLYGARRDLLLLTATPVNNSLWDLYYLLSFFIRQDGFFADKGIRSIKSRFDQAMSQDPTDLSPDLLFPIVDATTVKRTRQFIKKHYANDTIVHQDGTVMPIVFPEPIAKTERYNLDARLPGFFDQVEAALDPDSENCLSFARYMPGKYLLDAEGRKEASFAEASSGLLRSGLLKRFESSSYAFGRTVSRMQDEHDKFLNALEKGFVVDTHFLKELSGDDEAAFEDLLNQTEHYRDSSDYDIDSLRTAVEFDNDILFQLAKNSSSIEPQNDPKLIKLCEILACIASQAELEASSNFDEIQKRKVLVFSYFEDTVQWIVNYLQTIIPQKDELRVYDGRIAAISGSGNISQVAEVNSVREAAVGFAPKSMSAPNIPEGGYYDLLISTDVLSEGVNLQQCRNIVNFDLPWNPMRLVQRHGRIDRIDSPHKAVYMRTVFPTNELDRLLNLEQMILNKLAQAAATVGVESPVEDVWGGSQVFTETRDEIEKLLEQDSTLYERGGTVSATQTGEEYRQTLRNALKCDRRRVINLPHKVGSGMVTGNRQGFFFAAVVDKRTFLRFLPSDDDWKVPNKTEVVRETGACLRIIECEPDTRKSLSDSIRNSVYDFWDAARCDIHDEWMFETDPANLQPKVRPLNLRVAEFIRANQPAGIAQVDIEKTLDILETPWPRRDENRLREWFESTKLATEASTNGRTSQSESSLPSGHVTVNIGIGDEHDSTHSAPVACKKLIEQILGTGLEPGSDTEPLPPISIEEIQLLCWLGIRKKTD